MASYHVQESDIATICMSNGELFIHAKVTEMHTAAIWVQLPSGYHRCLTTAHIVYMFNENEDPNADS